MSHQIVHASRWKYTLLQLKSCQKNQTWVLLEIGQRGTWQTAPRAAVSKFPIMGNSCRTDDSVFVLKQQKSFQRKRERGREGNCRSKKLKRLINQS